MPASPLPDRPGELYFRPMDAAAAQAIHAWRYEPPYDVYNLGSAPLGQVVADFLDPANAYYQILGPGDELLAYCCYGPDARVPGGDYQAPALDVGLGVRPDLTGQGRGALFAGAAVDFARRRWAPAALRVTVAAFNQRALRTWQKLGFRPLRSFVRGQDGLPFRVLLWPAPAEGQ